MSPIASASATLVAAPSGPSTSGSADNEPSFEDPDNLNRLGMSESAFEQGPSEGNAAAASRVGSRTGCLDGSGTVISVRDMHDQSFRTNSFGEAYLPEEQTTVACESKKAVGAPYAHVQERTWTEVQTVGVDADHALGPLPGAPGSNGARYILDVEQSDLKITDSGATRARLTGLAAKGVAGALKVGSVVAVPFGGLAVGAINLPAAIGRAKDPLPDPPQTGDSLTPTTDAAFDRVGAFVADHAFGGAQIRPAALKAKLQAEQAAKAGPAAPTSPPPSQPDGIEI